MCVDVNNNTLLSEKNMSFISHTQTDNIEHNIDLIVTHRRVQKSSVVKG